MTRRCYTKIPGRLGGNGWALHFTMKCNDFMGNDIKFSGQIFHCLDQPGCYDDMPTASKVVGRLPLAFVSNIYM